MSNLHEHALREFKAAGWTDDKGSFDEPMQELLCKQILELLDLFSEHGHSGSSAPYAIGLFTKLAEFKPIVPLTGKDFEWNEVGKGVYQNNRCSAVFKDNSRFDGKPYYLDAVVFWEWFEDDDGKSKSHFTNGDSAKVIKFPYTPKTVYKQVKR